MICRKILSSSQALPLAAITLTTVIWANLAAAANVTATRLDGTSVAGGLGQWTADEVRLVTPTGEQQIATNQLAALHLSTTPSAAIPVKAAVAVELIDGTILPVKDVLVDKSEATLTLSAAEGASGKPLVLPITQISVIRLRQIAGPTETQWNEIERQNLANDVVVILKKDGASLDYAEGVMGNISGDKIEFKLDGEPQKVDRAKIAGAIYYRPNRRLKAESRVTIQGASGLRASVAHIELKDSVLELTTAAGVTFSWPLADITLADFTAGKLLYLSDIEPASATSVPFIGLPSSAKLASEYGKLRRDKSAFGGSLTLSVRDSDSSAAHSSLRTFDKGLSLRSRSEVVYRLPADFQRFMAVAGIDPATTATGSVRLAIYGDDRILLETDITGDQPPQPIQLDLANATRLKIVVDYGQNLDTGDWLNLCDARIAK